MASVISMYLLLRVNFCNKVIFAKILIKRIPVVGGLNDCPLQAFPVSFINMCQFSLSGFRVKMIRVNLKWVSMLWLTLMYYFESGIKVNEKEEANKHELRK